MLEHTEVAIIGGGISGCAAAARCAGAQIRTHTTVTNIVHAAGKIQGVELEDGSSIAATDWPIARGDRQCPQGLT